MKTGHPCHMRGNANLCQFFGRRGHTVKTSDCIAVSTPPNPKTATCHVAPAAAMWIPSDGSPPRKGKSISDVRVQNSQDSSARPSLSATKAWIPADNEESCVVSAYNNPSFGGSQLLEFMGNSAISRITSAA